jgi:hypothetical protein
MTVALVIFIASLVLALPAMSAEVHDASGITRVGGYLLVVSIAFLFLAIAGEPL